MIIKRSVRIAGHMTSISLEEPFWDALKDLAKRQNISLSVLIGKVDETRDSANLSSALRVYVLEQARK